MPFEFNPQQPSKPSDKKDKPSFDFNIQAAPPKPADKSDKPSFDFGSEKPASKPADKSDKPSFDFGSEKTASKPTDNKVETKKINIASQPVSKSTAKSTATAKIGKSGSKTADSSGRGKRASSPKNPFQDKRVLIGAGVGAAVLLLIIVAIASNFGGKSEPAPQPNVRRNLTPEEAKRERLRKITAKYDAQYAAEKKAPKSEKQQLMSKAESQRNQGDYSGAVETLIKVHQMDPTDGYPVSQLISIYRENLHDKVQAQKWEQVNNDIVTESLEQLQKKSEDRYNKTTPKP